MTTQTDPFARYRSLVDDWTAFQATIKRPLPVTIWANPLKITPDQLAAHLTDSGVPHEPIPWFPGGFRLPADLKPGLRWEYVAGLFHVQEEVALLPTLLLDTQPGERVLDLCAAPGNKTAQLSLDLHNRGTLVANDRNIGRMRAARQGLNRLGLINVTVTTMDGGNYPRASGLFDKVLVDVPCTCEGTCRKDPSLLRQPVNSAKLVGVQKALLRKAVQRTRPNGRIVYATCTFAPEENELIVDAILQEMGELVRVVPVTLPDGFVASPGLTEWDGQPIDPSLAHAIRVWPHQNDTGGFFIAVLERTAVSASSVDEVETAVFQVEEEREPWLSILHDRFGLAPSLFDDYLLFRPSRKRLYLFNRDHRPPEKPAPDSIGMHFMRVEGRYPKLTTGAAMLFGQQATKNVVDLTADQVRAFFFLQPIAVTAVQASQIEGNGYVIVRYETAVVGQAVYYADHQQLDSLFPKAWQRDHVDL